LRFRVLPFFKFCPVGFNRLLSLSRRSLHCACVMLQLM
jgi:hypothetical protein